MLLFAACVSTLPWLGLVSFNTKGEPREAVVSLTMLERGDWALPRNNGGEMAYKPPFFHWAVAAVSLLRGRVTEWTARFPSALAAICLAVWMFVFFARRGGGGTALLASAVFLSSFEVYRAAYACRVDMMLALGICGAMFSLVAWEMERGWWRYALAVLMMSMGTLTKGPVAVVLPCMAAGIYMLLRRRSVAGIVGWLLLAALLSLVLPSLWYAAAYERGGEAFLSLVKEENLSRFMGKMTYRSHENGLWYYFAMLPASLLPWTLPALWQCWRKRRSILPGFRKLSLSPETLFAIVAFAVVFVFYCIPKSKRGVYLLPLYPFAAWFVALLIRSWPRRAKRIVCTAVLALWTATFAIALPLALNKRSDKDIAADVKALTQSMGPRGPLVGYVAGDEAHDPPHFFTVNFYLHDDVGKWQGQPEGYLLIGERDVPTFVAEHRQWEFRRQYVSRHKSCDTKQRGCLYWFYLR